MECDVEFRKVEMLNFGNGMGCWISESGMGCCMFGKWNSDIVFPKMEWDTIDYVEFGHVVRNDGCINSITEFEVVDSVFWRNMEWDDWISENGMLWADFANRMEWEKETQNKA